MPLNSTEEEGTFFDIYLAEGDDPIIQLATPAEYLLALKKGDSHSTTVDEEIEILDLGSDATSKPTLDPASNDDLTVSSSSDCSAPPGFYIKGKYLSKPHTTDSSADIAGQGQASMAAWKQHFASEVEGLAAIQVPLDWVDFICATLLTPDKFEWAKMFLKSPMWHIIREGAQHKDYLNFYIPESCPISEAPICSQVPTGGDEGPFSSPPKGSPDKEDVPEEIAFCSSTATQGKRKHRAPVAESEVRRSERLQHLNKGYKKTLPGWKLYGMCC